MHEDEAAGEAGGMGGEHRAQPAVGIARADALEARIGMQATHPRVVRTLYLGETDDVFGEVDGCLISIDRARAVSGTATFAGYCDEGLNPAGYSLTLSGALPVTKSCPTDGGTADTATEISLTGEAAVEAINL